jgi:predicted small lipoprotein YifL
MKLSTTSLFGTQAPALVLLMVSALALTACGGGGSSLPPAPQNAAPTVSTVAAQTIDQDTSTGAVSFTVNDDSGPGGVTVTASSSNAAVIPAAGITLGGTGGARTITLVPSEDATGQTTVTLTATDPQGLVTSGTFAVTVRAVQQSILTYTTTTFGQSENDDPAKVSGFTFVQDADDDTSFDSLLQ